MSRLKFMGVMAPLHFQPYFIKIKCPSAEIAAFSQQFVIDIGGSLAQTPNIELSTYEDSISNFCIRMILANIYSVLFTNHVNSSLRSASHLNTDRN